jgi:5-oxopent-3-ene-1,2,5-tricarboxylate decarboxylase/2-hydroxyhepta-2,4-diene-1,7-dioate isomerase
MITGTLYGVVLNDGAERALLASAFTQPPYQAPPQAPVLYIKPRACLAPHQATVPLPVELDAVEAAATIGLLLGRDARRVSADQALDHVTAACLALDVTQPHDSYYRPAVRHRGRDAFLPAGALAPFDPRVLEGEILTEVDGQMIHHWSPRRLVRQAATLIADISAFMTLAAGDLLLVGLPHDAPRVTAGQRVTAFAGDLPPVTAVFARERVA